MSVTAKVTLQAKGPALDGQRQLTFVPDYADGRNKEWAKYTPTLHLTMTVKDSVAEQFEPGQAFTLVFEPAQ